MCRLNRLKGALAGILIAVVLFSTVALPLTVAAEPSLGPAPTTSAQASILMDEYGQILSAHNSDASLPMASTTKIMTALVALESCDPEQIVEISSAAVGVEGSSAYLMAGEKMSMLTLLYALMLQSANDAAIAISVAIDGSVEAFVERMNRKAEELGLNATHFTNPHGLDDVAHYTSARDLATLTLAALQNDIFARIVSTVRYNAPVEGSESDRLFVNHNRLLKEYDGCIGVKTGYTKRTGRCLVSAARRQGITLVAVTLNDPNDWRDHKALLDYGFSRIQSTTIVEAHALTVEIPIVGGQSKRLVCTNRDTVSLMLPSDSQPTLVLEHPRFVYGGIAEGDRIGCAAWYLNGRRIAEAPLYAGADCPPVCYEKSLLQRIADFVASIFAWIKNLFQNG